MKDVVISDAVKYIGADDKDLDLFESQYIVPNGVSYNSYVILDEKIAVMATTGKGSDRWCSGGKGFRKRETKPVWICRADLPYGSGNGAGSDHPV